MKRLQATGGQKPQEISTKSKLETSASTRTCVVRWAFSIFVDRQLPRGRQNQGSIQTQRLKSGALNKGTHENNPTSPLVVYFLPALPIARPRAHNTWKTYQQREAKRVRPKDSLFHICIWRVTFLSSTYVYKQASINSGVVWGARLCVVFTAGGEISLRLIWEQSTEPRGEHQSSKQKHKLIEHLTTGGCVQCRGRSHIP